MFTDVQYYAYIFSKMKLCLKLILIKLFFLTLIDNTFQKCDYKFSNLTNTWIKFHEIPATWTDARLRCTLEGSILASPVSKDILSEMLYVLRSASTLRSKRIYTGIHSIFSHGEYFTVDGKRLQEFDHFWADNEPDNKNNEENCLILNSNGDLADVTCGSTFPYICIKFNASVTNNICGTDDPKYTLDATTQKCYKFHTTPRNFSRAHFTCSAEGGHLAIINSQAESEALKNLFAKNPPSSMLGNFWKEVAFIGFHDWGERGEWRTIHGETLEEAGFTKFSGGEPNNATEGEYCGSIYRNGLLNDLWCERRFAFICERELSCPRICDPVKYNLHALNLENTSKKEVPEKLYDSYENKVV